MAVKERTGWMVECPLCDWMYGPTDYTDAQRLIWGHLRVVHNVIPKQAGLSDGNHSERNEED